MGGSGRRAAVAVVALAGCDSAYFEVFDGGVAPDASGVASPCVAFDVRQLELSPSFDRATVAVPLSDGAALVGTASGAYYRVATAGIARLPLATPGFSPRSGWKRPGTEEIWLGGRDGTLMRGGASGFTRASTASAGVAIRWLGGAPAGEELEVFGMSDNEVVNRFVRFDGRRFEVLYDRRTAPEEMMNGGAATWYSPGEAFGITRYARCVRFPRCALHSRRAASGAFTVGEDPLPVDEPATTLAVIDGMGPVAATAHGYLMRYGNGVWVELTDAPLPKIELAGRHTRVLLSFRGGLLQVAERFLAQYHPGSGGCPDPARLGGALYSVDVAALIEGGVVISGEPYAGRPAVVIVATPR